MKNVEKSFDEIAGEWSRIYCKPRPWLKFFYPFLKKRMVALDAGCGNAQNAIAIAPRVKKVFAVDVSRKMLEFAEKNVEEAGFRKKIFLKRASVVALPFEKGFFDAALYIAVLPHLYLRRARARAFKEMNRVLKKGESIRKRLEQVPKTFCRGEEKGVRRVEDCGGQAGKALSLFLKKASCARSPKKTVSAFEKFFMRKTGKNRARRRA